MSGLKEKTFEQWYKDKYDPTGYLYPSAPLNIGFQDYCARVDEYLRYLANGVTTVEKQCNLHCVSFNEAEYCNKCGKRKKMKGDGTLELLCECSEVEVCAHEFTPRQAWVHKFIKCGELHIEYKEQT